MSAYEKRQRIAFIFGLVLPCAAILVLAASHSGLLDWLVVVVGTAYVVAGIVALRRSLKDFDRIHGLDDGSEP